MATDLIIDGYNLLHATGIFGRGVGPGGLERARQALVRLLVASLEPDQRERTTVVFDATSAAGRGLPRSAECGGVRVLYASRFENADAQIEQLIDASHAPRNLVVVSSDRRVQRAARRRRATPIDSGRWYAQLLVRRQQRQASRRADGAKPVAEPTEAEVQYWLSRFNTHDPDVPADPATAGTDDLFPPGYAEDLLDEQDEPGAQGMDDP